MILAPTLWEWATSSCGNRSQRLSGDLSDAVLEASWEGVPWLHCGRSNDVGDSQVSEHDPETPLGDCYHPFSAEVYRSNKKAGEISALPRFPLSCHQEPGLLWAQLPESLGP